MESLPSETVEALKLVMGSPKLESAIAERPAVYGLADRLGQELGQQFLAHTWDAVTRALSSLWAGERLGSMEWLDDRRGFALSDCYDCAYQKIGLESAGCGLKSRVITAILRQTLGIEFEATETACCRLGDRACVFVLAPAP